MQPRTEPDQAVEYIKCYVTEDLFDETEMCLDINTGRWFHKSKAFEYNDMCAVEFGWSEEEKAENLEILKSWM